MVDGMTGGTPVVAAVNLRRIRFELRRKADLSGESRIAFATLWLD
jgi:hypothetical protein